MACNWTGVLYERRACQRESTQTQTHLCILCCREKSGIYPIHISCLNHAVAVPLVETFFAERAINVWNFLPSSVNFSSLAATFRRSIQDIDFTDFLKCGLY